MVRIGFSPLEALLYDRYQAESVLVPVASRLADLAQSLPGSASWLDVGCGGGHALAALSDCRPDVVAAGLDISSPQLRAARRRLASATTVRFVRGSAATLPFRGAAFDAAVALFSIKHWPDRRGGLAECARVLRPGGRVLVAEIDGDATFGEWRRWVATGCMAPVLRQGFSVGAYFAVVRSSVTVPVLDDLLRRAGFARVSVERVPGYPVVAGTGTVTG
ncbi:MAG TPA: methyltransferase domain-containing protein [Mycobacteriales bacterium]|jgi:ubiquinone/menaquinone biosynthesis C-methylase UbiE|nr:methyltransferase domain-containing protein [Mycobacteriales bacterium]